MYILNIMTGKWTRMNETLPRPSLSFQGGDIKGTEFLGWGNFGKRFQGEDKRMIYYLDSRSGRSMTERRN